MKTTKVISMAEFAKEVEKIALNKGKSYHVVYCEIGKFIHADGTQKPHVTFKLYIDGFGFSEGKTPNECLNKLKEKISPKKSIVEEVLL